MVEKYEHNLYKHTQEIKDANAVAFAAVSKEKFEFFPYNHPKLEAKEIRANVLYTGLCHSDSLHARSKWGECPYPMAPGHEIIAEVSEVGSDVKDFKKGDKVGFGTMRWVCDSCKNCKNNREPLCLDKSSEEKFTYGYHFGGYSTTLQQPASHFFKLPEKLDLEKAPPLLCAGITVYSPMLKYLKPGMKTAVIGIGGLGHLACQFLSKLGHEVTAISHSPEKFEFYKQFGVNNIVNLKSEDDVKKNAGAFDFIVNTVPDNHSFTTFLSFTAKGGTFVQVGVAEVSQNINFPTFLLVANEINLVGSLVGSREDIRNMLQLCADKDIYPVIEMFKFEDFPKALDKLENGKPIFRCVVDVAKYSQEKGLFK